MGSILKRSDLSESEKSRMFGETLFKFKTFHQNAQQPNTVTDIIQPSENKKEPTIYNKVLDSVTKAMRHNAQMLLDSLEGNPKLRWNSQGSVQLYGKHIQVLI